MTNSPIKHFLLVFDHDKGRLVDRQDFGVDSREALAAYAAKEAEYWEQPRIEVVLVGSDSIETVRRTHANYFEETPGLSKYLVGIVTERESAANPAPGIRPGG